jgi:membrane protease subunit HflK
MQQIFSNVSKVFVDTQGSGNLLYLPLDRLLQGGASTAVAPGAAQPNMAPAAAAPVDRSVPDADAARRQGLTRDRDR